MKADIPYGKKNIKISITEPFEVLVPKKVRIKDEDKLIENALHSPLGAEPFDDFANNSEKILVIINDATRPTPTSKILEYLTPVLSSHPDVKFLVATGSHRAPTEDEYKFILGETYEIFRQRTHAHDARKDEDMAYLGKSKNGTEMYINKLVLEYKNILLINSVEPHYFAGYTGGRKSFLPGVASYKTIEMNHKFALDEKSSTLALKNNPVHEDMMEMASFLNHLNIFSIQIVLTTDSSIYQVTTGNLNESFLKAIDYANEIFCVSLKKKGNIVITAAAHPSDINLYQSQKALENGKLALEKDGIIILVSQCKNGIGDQVFFDLLSKASKPSEVFNFLKKEYKLGYHKAAKIAELGMKDEIWAVTDLDEGLVKKAMLKPYSNIQKAIDDAVELIKLKGKKPRLIVMPYGNLTVPNI